MEVKVGFAAPVEPRPDSVTLYLSLEEAKDLAALVFDAPRTFDEGRTSRFSFRGDRPWVYELESALGDIGVEYE